MNTHRKNRPDFIRPMPIGVVAFWLIYFSTIAYCVAYWCNLL